MRARISYAGFISNKRNSRMRTKDYSNVRLRFRTADSHLAGTIRYGIGTCTHGALLVTRGDDGIWAILMGDKADLLHEELAEVFPFNRLEKSSTLRHDLAAVASFIDDSQPDVQLDFTVGARPSSSVSGRHCARSLVVRLVLIRACAEYWRGRAARGGDLRCKHIGDRDPLPQSG